MNTKLTCPHCHQDFETPFAGLVASLRHPMREDIAVVSTWNVPYSTGTWFLSRDHVTREEVEKYASEHVHFPFWPLQYLGKLWSKDTWDD